ncbi:MAG: M28 family peptidase, partial [Bacteroidota bacterium]
INPMIQKYILTVIIFCFTFASYGQKVVKQLKASVTKESMEAKLRFLASDELRGRDVGTPEIDIAALYIAEHYRANGLKTPPGLENYFQKVPLINSRPASVATLTMGDKQAVIKKDLVFLDGKNGQYAADAVFLNYGLEADYEGIDVKGKIVVVLPGNESIASPRDYRNMSSEKQQLATEAGAVGLVELYKSRETPWRLIANFLSRPGMKIGEQSDENRAFLVWLQDIDGTWENAFRSGQQALSVKLEGSSSESVTAKNVVGWIEGKDPKKKDEYLLMTAHYDHVGVRKSGEVQDSIYNGARDNAIGVATLMETVTFLSKNRPDYSVIFIACTAEEKGLLGSRWYAENPLFPLEKTFFNFNTDGAGYNDTSIATVVGFERTSVNAKLAQSVKPFGLQVIGDPEPAQNLFDRSDNVNFAKQGIPALTFSCGFRAFDQELMKYYHQPADEVETLDMVYLEKYARSFVYAAYLIANTKEKPFWNDGDKYEKAGKALYGIE